MSERRKLKRRYLMFYSRVFDRINGKLLGYLSDITIGGAMIISEEPVESGRIYLMRMDLPEEFYDRQSINLQGRCIWCRPDINPSFWNIGFQLIDLKPDEAQLIDQIVSDYGMSEDRSMG